MNRTPTALEQFFQLVVQSNGVELPRRPTVNFIGGTVTDDPVNNVTQVQLTGGGGGGGTSLQANFTQPAVQSTASAQVMSSGGFAIGQSVFIFGGGFYLIDAIPDGTHLTIENTGAVGNVAPGTTVTSGVLVVPSGPPWLLVQNNGAAITQRRSLDLIGFTYADDAGGNRMKFTSNPTLAGDVTGTASASTVVALQSVPMVSTTPTDQQVLTFVASSGKWTPQTPAVGFIAGGDLGGTATSQEVIGILNKALPSLPGSDQYLHYSGSAWAFSALPTSLPPSGSASGDLSGSYPGPTVAKVNGSSVPAGGSLTTGNVLQVSAAAALIYAALNLAGGAGYVTGVLPTANQASQSMGGDVSGTTASATVAAIQGNTVTSGALTKGQFFVASSTSNWAATSLSGDVSESATTPGQVTLVTSGVSAGTYGDGTHVGQFTVDAKGRITTATSVTITGAAPTGSASGDLSGTYPGPTVAAIQGNTVTSGALTKGQFLVATSTSNWAATTLSGDVSESATTAGQLTVTKVNTATVPAAGSLTTGNVLQVNGASSLTYAAVNLAGGANFVTGTLPAANQAAQTLGGDLSGTTASATVVSISGASPIAITPASLQWLNSTASPTITQANITTASGQALTIQAQSATGASNNGGDLNLAAGTSGSASGGSVHLQTNGITRLTAGNGGNVSIQNLSTGIVHADSFGVLSSSTLVNADVSATAAIAVSKLAAGTSAQLLLSNATPTATWTTLGGDATISATGSLTVGKISGSTPIVISPNEFQWANTATPLLDQAAPASSAGAGTAGNAFAVTAQTGGATTGSATTAGAGAALNITSGTGGSGSGGTNASGGAGGNVVINAAAGGAKSGTGTVGANGQVLLETGGTTRLTIGATGTLTVAGLNSAGLVHTDASGNLSTTLLVNADVSSSAAIAVSKLAAGTSAQVLLNSATPTPTWTTLSGDVTVGSTGTTTVGAISGSSPISVTPNTLQWIQGATGPTLSQAQQANGSNPVNFTVAPQAPGAGASTTSTGTPGSFVVNVAVPVSTGTEAGIILQRNGSLMVALYGGSHGSIWFDSTTSSTGNKITGAGPQLAYNAASSGHTWSVDGVGGGLMALATTLSLAVKINYGSTVAATTLGDLGMDRAGSSGRPQAFVDGVAHGLSAWRGYFGDGSDGSATCDGSTTVAGMSAPSGNTYTMTRDCYFTSLTINSGVTVLTAAYRLFVRDTLTHNGTAISNNGAQGTGTSAGGAVSTFTLGGSGSGGNGGASPAGGSNTLKAYGGSGGIGGDSGGAAGTATAPTASQGSIRQIPEAVLGAILSQNSNGNPTFFSVMGGAGGGGGGGTNGGGGGSGGGVIGIYARILTGNGPINAKGGAGVNAGATSGGGGGGGGGAIILVVGDKSSWTGTTSVAGGAAGSSTTGSAAGAGSSGTVITIMG